MARRHQLAKNRSSLPTIRVTIKDYRDNFSDAKAQAESHPKVPNGAKLVRIRTKWDRGQFVRTFIFR